VNRDPFVRPVLNTSHHVLGGPRPNHTKRLDLIDTTVAGVKLEEKIVTTDVSDDQPSQVVLDSCSLDI
jgi:hypothetical protein